MSGGATRWSRLLRFAAYLGVAIVVARAWHFVAANTTWEFVKDAPAQAKDLFDRMLPPEWGYVAELPRPLWETFNIATLGTLCAVVLALPCALLAAHNTTPHRLLRGPALLAIVASRSVNALLWALLLVAVLGPGPLAGILAIALRSCGFIAKLLYEALEEADAAPVEAVTATGAGRAQVVLYGLVPQVLPAFAGIAAFRWDINVREAAVVGLVGAGGLGLPLDAAVAGLQWERASAILAVVFAMVLLAEAVSARVRRAVT